MLTTLAAGAAGSGGGTDYIQWALDQGGAFLVALVCAYGWWLAEKRVTKADTRADTERIARDVLVEQFMDRVIPALEKSTAANVDAAVAIARTLSR